MRAAAEKFVEEPEAVTTMPQDWGFHVHEDVVIRAYSMWEASDFRHFPKLEDCLNEPTDFVRDILLFARLVRFKKHWKESGAPGATTPPKPNTEG